MAHIPEDSLERLWYLRREVDRVFREFFDLRQNREGGSTLVDVQADVCETDAEIIIEMELPGVTTADLRVFIQRDIVMVEGELRDPAPRNPQRHLCMERRFGPFRRVIDLPGAADANAGTAQLDRGVLIVTIPKIKERRGQKRLIKVL